MKRFVAVLLMLCILSSFCLYGYAAEIEREFNTQPGTITEQGQAILDARPVLTVFVCIAAGIFVICVVLLVLSAVRCRRTSRELRVFCTNLGWVKTVPDVHICAKISIILCAFDLFLPVTNMLVSFNYMSGIKNLTLDVFLTVFLTSCLTSLILMFLVSTTGLVLSIIGIQKSRKRTTAMLACIVHGLILLFFFAPALAGL